MRIELPLLARLRSTLGGASGPRSEGPALAPGSLAEILVTARMEQDRILFTIGSQELVAKNTAGLEVGQRVLVQIQPGQTEAGEMILQVLPDPPQESSVAAAKLKPLLTVKSDLGPLLKELKDILRELPAKPGSPLEKAAGQVKTTLAESLVRPDLRLESSLKSLSSRLGLDYEARLARAVATPGAGREAEAGSRILSSQLKPALLALVRELKPILNQAAPDRSELPGLNRLTAELREALTLLKGGSQGPESRPGARSPSLTAAGQVPGRETGPAPAPPSPLDGPLLKAVLKLPRPAEITTVRSPGQEGGVLESGREPDRGLSPEAARDLALNLGRLKGAFIRKAVGILEQELAQKDPVSADPALTRPDSALVRAETARVVRTVWSETARTLARPEADPQALATQMETALRGMALRLGALSQIQAQAALTGTEEALRGLEAVQLLNAMALETETSLVLPLPLAPAWGAQSGQVFFYKPPYKKGSDQGERPLRMVFLLEMSRLGPVRVDVSMVKKDLMINLYLAKTTALERVSAKLGRLEENLTEMGYRIRSLNARAVKAAPPLEEVVPRAVEVRPKGFIDIKT